MKIVTWNINGVRARIGNLTHWLSESAPDIVCLQELKSVDEQFPRAEVEALGYHVETHGQKGFNGVAILSKLRFDEVSRGLPGADTDEQARFIEGVFSTPSGALRVASLYLPNGNPIGTDKFVYKLAWMERLERWAADRLAHLGFTDAIRAVSDADGIYTFWDYQAGAWQKNNGIRIDHLMLSPEAADRLRSAFVEKHVRAWEKPSDHVPTAVVLSL